MAFSFDSLVGGFDSLWNSTLSKFNDVLELGFTPGDGELSGGVSSQLGDQAQNQQTAPVAQVATIPIWVWLLLALAAGFALPKILK